MDTQAPWRSCSDPARPSSVGSVVLVLRDISLLICGNRVLQNGLLENVRKGCPGLVQTSLLAWAEAGWKLIASLISMLYILKILLFQREIIILKILNVTSGRIFKHYTIMWERKSSGKWLLWSMFATTKVSRGCPHYKRCRENWTVLESVLSQLYCSCYLNYNSKLTLERHPFHRWLPQHKRDFSSGWDFSVFLLILQYH